MEVGTYRIQDSLPEDRQQLEFLITSCNSYCWSLTLCKWTNDHEYLPNSGYSLSLIVIPLVFPALIVRAARKNTGKTTRRKNKTGKTSCSYWITWADWGLVAVLIEDWLRFWLRIGCGSDWKYCPRPDFVQKVTVKEKFGLANAEGIRGRELSQPYRLRCFVSVGLAKYVYYNISRRLYTRTLEDYVWVQNFPKD